MMMSMTMRKINNRNKKMRDRVKLKGSKRCSINSKSSSRISISSSKDICDLIPIII